MRDFGNYGVIITDQNEFMKRIGRGLEKFKYKYLAGSVAYHPLTLHGRKLKEAMYIRHCLHPDLFSIEQADLNAPEYDAFDKWDMHKDEFEWRILLNRYSDCVNDEMLRQHRTKLNRAKSQQMW